MSGFQFECANARLGLCRPGNGFEVLLLFAFILIIIVNIIIFVIVWTVMNGVDSFATSTTAILPAASKQGRKIWTWKENERPSRV